MTVVHRVVAAPVDEVFAALITPESYPEWLVGCREIRAVDDNWPETGSRFHHRVGLAGPLTVADSTKVLEIDEPNRLVLEVRARPFGRGRSEFRLEPAPAGDGGQARTSVTLEEKPIGLLEPTAPVMAPVIRHRNGTSLDALARYVTGRTSD